jgi:hypothetical protein
MRVLTMSAFSAVFALATAACSGCAPPHFDLTQPVYLSIEESFYQGCEPRTSCREDRELVLTRGAKMWFGYYDEDVRPQAVLVRPGEELPRKTKNEPIKIQADFSAKPCEARWYWSGSETKIRFTCTSVIEPHYVAHELGHALGMLEHETDRQSIMLSPKGLAVWSNVTPYDLQQLCGLHTEVRCPPTVWCEGTFYDRCRCPSATPEEGEKLMQEQGCLNP